MQIIKLTLADKNEPIYVNSDFIVWMSQRQGSDGHLRATGTVYTVLVLSGDRDPREMRVTETTEQIVKAIQQGQPAYRV